MEKDPQLPIDSDKCDVCGEPATHFVVEAFAVAGHPELSKASHEKKYCEEHVPVKFKPTKQE